MLDLSAGSGRGLAFAGNDRLLAIGQDRVDVWALPSGRYVRSLEVGAPVTSVAATGDGRLAATLAAGEVNLWDLETGATLARLSGSAEAIGFSPDGRHLVTISGNDAVLWDTASGRRLQVLRGHKGAITHFAFSAQGGLLVTGSLDHDARVWSVTDGRLLSVLRGHLSPIQGVSTSADGRWVVTAGHLTVILWESAGGRLLFMIEGPGQSMTDVALSPHGRTLIAGNENGFAYRYRCDVCADMATLEALATQRLELAPAGVK